jgi:hypothetical protein
LAPQKQMAWPSRLIFILPADRRTWVSGIIILVAAPFLSFPYLDRFCFFHRCTFNGNHQSVIGTDRVYVESATSIPALF